MKTKRIRLPNGTVVRALNSEEVVEKGDILTYRSYIPEKADGMAIEEAKPKWIAVSDRLPESTTYALCQGDGAMCTMAYWPVEGQRTEEGFKHPKHFQWTVLDAPRGYLNLRGEDVTHWMPLT